MSFFITNKLHNRRNGGGAKEQGAIVRLTGTNARFNIYSAASTILSAQKGDYVGIVCAKLSEDAPEAGYIFLGDAGTKGTDASGKVVYTQPCVGSQLSSIVNSDNALSFSMSHAYDALKTLHGEEFASGKKGAIKFVISETPAATLEEYEGMRNVSFYELTPVKVSVEEEEEEEDGDGAMNDAPTTNNGNELA